MNFERHVFFAGKVQGVGFRYSVKQIANGHDVTGWVRNHQDGRVELVARGSQADVDTFIDAIKQSHLRHHIREVEEVPDGPIPEPLTRFEIRH